MRILTFDEGYRPETSVIFLLVGTGIGLVLLNIYPIVPYAPGFLHSFLLLVTVAKGIGLRRSVHFYCLVLELFGLVLLIKRESVP